MASGTEYGDKAMAAEATAELDRLGGGQKAQRGVHQALTNHEKVLAEQSMALEQLDGTATELLDRLAPVLATVTEENTGPDAARPDRTDAAVASRVGSSPLIDRVDHLDHQAGQVTNHVRTLTRRIRDALELLEV